ncbi:activating transcription factor 7-interacting protein 1-like isoform X2 [Prorops nasuta]|uniref:activating transcription factor 7-interacting protein 1-like isoform X2 n=1 Tax=Prorops nasuta TaxID=863751 RepID=UPI0034CF6448
METVIADTVHVSESNPSTHSPLKVHAFHGLSKKEEEELLLETGNDEDDEDALSDDSLRLRLSDDDDCDLEEPTVSLVNAKTEDLKKENSDSQLLNIKEEHSFSLKEDKINNTAYEPLVSSESLSEEATQKEITKQNNQININMDGNRPLSRSLYEMQQRYPHSPQSYRYFSPNRNYHSRQVYSSSNEYGVKPYNGYNNFKSRGRPGRNNNYNNAYSRNYRERWDKVPVKSQNLIKTTETSNMKNDNEVLINDSQLNETRESEDVKNELEQSDITKSEASNNVLLDTNKENNCLMTQIDKKDIASEDTHSDKNEIKNKCENKVSNDLSNNQEGMTGGLTSTIETAVEDSKKLDFSSVSKDDKISPSTDNTENNETFTGIRKLIDIENNLENKTCEKENDNFQMDCVEESKINQDSDCLSSIQVPQTSEDNNDSTRNHFQALELDDNTIEIKQLENNIHKESVENQNSSSIDTESIGDAVREETLEQQEKDINIQDNLVTKESLNKKIDENTVKEVIPTATVDQITNENMEFSDEISEITNGIDPQIPNDVTNCKEQDTNEQILEIETSAKLKTPTINEIDNNTTSITSPELRNNCATGSRILKRLKIDANVNYTASIIVDSTKSMSDDQQKRRRSQRVRESVKEIGRQKRKTAKTAEEMIRKKYLNEDRDTESSDSTESLVSNNHKTIAKVNSTTTASSVKRPLSEVEIKTTENSKKLKKEENIYGSTTKTVELEDLDLKIEDKHNVRDEKTILGRVRKFFERDAANQLKKLTQEELEELIIQKIIETITMRDEIGKLREQARISERNQEATRAKCQQLGKQIKDFEMVISRHASDRRGNADKTIMPVKINRSVGLQVNFITDHGIQNLRQLQSQSSLSGKQQAATVNSNNVSSAPSEIQKSNKSLSPKRGLKIHSPRRSDQLPVTVISPATHSQTFTTSTSTSSNNSTKHLKSPIMISNQTGSGQQILPSQQTAPQQQHVILNGKVSNQPNRPIAPNISKSKTSDLIDLTDEEEKKSVKLIKTTAPTSVNSAVTITPTNQAFPHVIQTLPTNVAITSQANIKLVQTPGQTTPAALNNMNSPRVTYVMQSSGPSRQLLIASGPNTSIRPATSAPRSQISVAYKQGMHTLPNGTVRLVATPATAQLIRHPAPLPAEKQTQDSHPSWKLPPPAPSLRISKVTNGIVLSWNMSLSDKYAEIASYQLYAYQEVAGAPPSSSLWKKVGDVRALPLPMACTLTQFSEGNNYYFAVRAVDTHSRKGLYSAPGNISL